MENIAEALKMAAGILIAVLLTSLLVYMYTNIRETEQQRLKNQERMAITEFNNRFNTFEKSSMYGTDIISVMGLAYNMNVKVNSQSMMRADGRYNPDAEGSVNIILHINTPIKAIRETKLWGIVNGKNVVLKEEKKQIKDVLGEGDHTLEIRSATRIKDEADLENIKKIVVNADKEIKHEIGTPQYDQNYNTRVWTEVIESASGFNDFKTRIFEYNPEYTKYDALGRIKVMKFSEKEKQ